MEAAASRRESSALAQIQWRCQVKEKQGCDRLINEREVTAELVHRQLVKCSHSWTEYLEVEGGRSQDEDRTGHGKTPTFLEGVHDQQPLMTGYMSCMQSTSRRCLLRFLGCRWMDPCIDYFQRSLRGEKHVDADTLKYLMFAHQLAVAC